MSQWIRGFKTLNILTLSAYMLAFGPIPVANAATRVNVPGGTLVMVRPTETISGKNARSGDTVNFVVAQDVKIGNAVVIRAGAQANGRVTEGKKAGVVGQPGKLAVELQTVRAVDGTMIPVRASSRAEGDDKVVLVVILTLICLPLILIPGGNAEISAGTTLDAYTLGGVDVDVP